MKFSEIKMSKKFKANVLLLSMLICLFTIVFDGFGAFISGGNLKGVATSGEYCFVSNVLQRISSEENVSSVSGSVIYNDSQITSKAFEINNYGVDNEPNTFAVDYVLKCKLTEADATHTYTIRKGNGTANTVTADGWTQISSSLAENVLSSDKYMLSISGEGKPTARIMIVAVPESPEYMKSYILGVTLRVAETEGFSISDAFAFSADSASQQIDNYSGFTYEITPHGYALEQKVAVKWNSDMLKISQGSKYTANGSADGFTWSTVDSVENTVNYKTLTITANSETSFEDIIKITFFRTDDFLPEYTFSDVENAVTLYLNDTEV